MSMRLSCGVSGNWKTWRLPAHCKGFIHVNALDKETRSTTSRTEGHKTQMQNF